MPDIQTDDRQRPFDAAAWENVVRILGGHFRGRFAQGKSVREQHGHTTTWIANQPPDAVVFAKNTEDVAFTVKTCGDAGVPVIAFGVGSSLEGHVNAPLGGVCIDLSGMNKILAINSQDIDCVVQPGVTRKQLNADLRDVGLFFPIDPGADATLGGMASTRASGTNAVRYGTMKDAVISLEAVMPDGEIIRTGQRARKSSAGYDLTHLLIGAEGTLGIITELTIRLHGIPETIASAVATFPTVGSASEAVIATIQYGVPVARLELLDSLSVKAINGYANLNFDEKPLLMVEFHGSQAALAEQMELFTAVVEEHGGCMAPAANSTEERTRIWQARHDAYWANLTLRPGAKGLSTDICVPISQLATCVEQAQTRAQEDGFIAPIVGHAGDGNFHVLPLIDMDDEQEVTKARAYVSWLNELAISAGGTCTGEHGIGQGKQDYMRRELGGAVDVMATIKQALDPHNIMNPGKILPSQGLGS